MSEENPWEFARENAKLIKAENRKYGEEEIYALEEHGYEVEKITDYQFRINGKVDIYPTRCKWHIFKGNHRGKYISGELLDFIETTLSE